MATIGFDITASGEYAIKREVVRTSLGAKHLIPLLKSLPLQLIVEDFHYLDEEVKTEIFQQWKAFVDEGVSVLVVSTTHHAIDIARANSDLTGRTRFIDLGR
jgi:ABC-type thiamine transport system ATPase subunit